MIDRGHFKPWARAGYTSRGIVYLIIGLFALLAAFGSGDNKSTKGALENLLSQPFGHILVGLLIIGLVGYVIWRLIQTIFDTDDHGYTPKGLGVRAGLLASAFTYTTLALYAASLLGVLSFMTGGGGGEGTIANRIAAFVGARPVALGMAAIFIIVGAAHWWKAITGKFEKHFDADSATMRWLYPVSVIGLTARGTVFFILAFMLGYRGVSSGDGETPGIKDALNFLQSMSYGSWLLGAMGVGIILFATYSFCEAIWRRINVSDAG